MHVHQIVLDGSCPIDIVLIPIWFPVLALAEYRGRAGRTPPAIGFIYAVPERAYYRVYPTRYLPLLRVPDPEPNESLHEVLQSPDAQARSSSPRAVRIHRAEAAPAFYAHRPRCAALVPLAPQPGRSTARVMSPPSLPYPHTYRARDEGDDLPATCGSPSNN
ncbi:hypothetical protein B0H17DRAFT_1123590 [Mycena rosella]|uniref:Uncharacterized protein n=1 Tax=Mycena rosella TaxID=1033263 RepID=A0AAD7H1Y4_MYCRO|nr:hypothetical protein B0H17DRAFT_1123590 [Mycena rosella]